MSDAPDAPSPMTDALAYEELSRIAALADAQHMSKASDALEQLLTTLLATGCDTEPLARALLSTMMCRGWFANKRRDLPAAFSAFTTALTLAPTFDAARTAIEKLLAANSSLGEFHEPLSVMFVTGTPFRCKPYDGASDRTRAIGGSESALIALARALAARGVRVGVYCPTSTPGWYDGVLYRPNTECAARLHFAPPRVLVVLRHDAYLSLPCPAPLTRWWWLQDVPDTVMYEKLQATDVRAADRALCLSAFHAALWVKRVPELTARISLTTNGGDPTIFSARSGAQTPTTLIYVSRPARGLREAAAAFAIARAQDPTLELVVCSYTPDAKAATLIDDPEISAVQAVFTQPGVRFVGGLTKLELAKIFRESLCLLYPNTSLLETSCCAAIEAMMSGCPVLTSDSGALPETVGARGGYVVSYEPHATLAERLAAQILTWRGNPDAWRAASTRAATYAHERFAWEKIAAQWHAWLNEAGVA